MAFTIELKTGNSITLDDDQGYEFLPGGILMVGSAKAHVYYAAGSWDMVRTDDGHRPNGRSKNNGGLW